MNLLMLTDIYKCGHMRQYKPGTTKIYSYLCARSAKYFSNHKYFGHSYYLQEYLSKPILPGHAEEFFAMYEHILKAPVPDDVRAKIHELCAYGRVPLEIRAVREGEIVPHRNVLMTITNTRPEFYWAVGFFESLLLKIWAPMATATTSDAYLKVLDAAWDQTVDEELFFLKPFMVHDFGYRGADSEEAAAITGAAHLLSFSGSDTIPALPFVQKYYGVTPKMDSVAASEHSVMCSFGREGESEAFEHMLDLYPTGIVSIVSDTYNLWDAITFIAGTLLKKRILERDGKVVFRPDSGDPELILCGNPNAAHGTPEHKGVIRLLDELFGSTVNKKGYKELNPKVGVIYGDGMYLERYKKTLANMAAQGYAASNLVIGVGGILRNNTRDTLGCAIKATYAEINGEPYELEKDPVTDPGKKSHKGLLKLVKTESGTYATLQGVTWEESLTGELGLVFRDGEVLRFDQPFQVA
jgi:nicotinamide phosphoribosyltransferase